MVRAAATTVLSERAKINGNTVQFVDAWVLSVIRRYAAGKLESGRSVADVSRKLGLLEKVRFA